MKRTIFYIWIIFHMILNLYFIVNSSFITPLRTSIIWSICWMFLFIIGILFLQELLRISDEEYRVKFIEGLDKQQFAGVGK
jgi:nitrogen fixation/metabolism regulation signal transduction histidine kinase